MNTEHSLEQLENSKWPERDLETRIQKRCHELRKIPLAGLQIEDLRLLIGQQIGLKYLVPVALEKLSTDPLAEGDLYPGDLLQSILAVDPAYWSNNKPQWTQLKTILEQHKDLLQDTGLKTDTFYSTS